MITLEGVIKDPVATLPMLLVRSGALIHVYKTCSVKDMACISSCKRSPQTCDQVGARFGCMIPHLVLGALVFGTLLLNRRVTGAP